MLHALLPVAQTVQKRPADPHGRCPERERFQYVSTPRDSTVDVDFTPVEDLGADAVQLQQCKHGRLCRVEGAAAVVREHDALDAVLDRSLRVRGALDPLDDNRQPRRLLDPGDVVPAQRLVDVLPHEPPHPAAFPVVGSHGAADGRGYVLGRDALVRLALPRHVGVDGDEDGLHAQLAGFAQQLRGFGAVGVDVELEEEGLVGAACLDDGGEGVGCVVRYLSCNQSLI